MYITLHIITPPQRVNPKVTIRRKKILLLPLNICIQGTKKNFTGSQTDVSTSSATLADKTTTAYNYYI